MTSNKITAIALVPMSNCLKSEWVSLISQHVERDPVLRALKIGSFPFPYMRGFLRQICFEKDPSSLILDTLQIEGDMDGIVKIIEPFIMNTTESAKSRVPEIGDGWGVFPLRTSEIIPFYLCPVKTKWKIGNMRYGDPFTHSIADFVLVLMSPPRIESDKDKNEWCKRIAAAIAGAARISAGVVAPTTFEHEYKPLTILEIEEMLKKQRSHAPMPASKGMITERATKDYFLNNDYLEIALRGTDPTTLDKQGIDLVFLHDYPPSTLAIVQVESKLHLSKLKKFSKNTERWFHRYRKKSSTKSCRKYYVAKDFDMKATEFARMNGISLLTFREIAKKCPQWKKALKEQGLLD